MGSPSRRPLLLLGAAALLLDSCLGSSSHSFQNFYVSVLEPGQRLPQFIAVGYVDGQPFVRYDSNTRRKLPLVPWIRKVVKDDPEYWDTQTRILQSNELVFRDDLTKLQARYNQSGGLHTLQFMCGCELSEDGPKGGYMQNAYDGRDFLSFDKETLTWMAADAAAQMTKRKWEAEPAFAQRRKAYLEEECIEWLRKYLDYGKETLLRRERPTVKVTRKAKAGSDSMETYICRAHGFYPKEIEINWMKDGEVWTEDTFHGQGPNPDGTYHSWLSIEIDPKERNRYWCHVEHDGLEEPLDLVLEKPAFVPVAVILGAAILLVVSVLLVAGIILYIKKQQKREYKAAPA